MTTGSDAQAFGGAFVYTTAGDAGTATWTFSVPHSGSYYVWSRVLAPNEDRDSFYARADGGTEDVFDDAEGNWSPNWQWSVLNGRNGTGVPLTLDPRVFSLSAGSNTIVFRGREANSRVDRILVTDNGNFVPTDGNTVTFTDVPPSNPFFDFVETLSRDDISQGCGGGKFCPDDGVTRAQMAVFLLKSKYGSGYNPPPATGGVFSDVHPGDFAAAWIEELAAQGITAGCASGKYCPNQIVSRAQMAVFLLRTKHGSSYVPPAPTGVFGDLDPNDPFTPWIEELAAEGITSGCGGGNYCPNDPSSREQMAAFLVKTFALP